MTLTTGSSDALGAVVLAQNSAAPESKKGGSASGGSSGVLGPGPICFAGGVGECVHAFDLRGGSAKPLYELSTGNCCVVYMAWHEVGGWHVDSAQL